MSKIFVTSDTHFGDERSLKFCWSRRVFSSVQEMDETIINNWNKVVSPDDIVYHLGDFCTYKSNLEEIKKFRSYLNGKIHLLKGNHDCPHDFASLIEDGTFESVRDDSFRLAFSDSDRVFHLCHYPVERNLEFYTLCGHIHEKWRVQKKMLNVGVDVNNFTPLSIEDVMFSVSAEENGMWDANVYPDADFDWRKHVSRKVRAGNCEPTQRLLRIEELQKEIYDAGDRRDSEYLDRLEEELSKLEDEL